MSNSDDSEITCAHEHDAPAVDCDHPHGCWCHQSVCSRRGAMYRCRCDACGKMFNGMLDDAVMVRHGNTHAAGLCPSCAVKSPHLQIQLHQKEPGSKFGYKSATRWPLALEDRDPRKIEIVFRTTPAELRVIAAHLEDGHATRVNWYHTRVIFLREDDRREFVDALELEKKEE